LPAGVPRPPPADRRNVAHDLVAEHRRNLRRGITELGDVRSAEAAALEPQQHLARADGGPGPVLGGEAGGAAIDRDLHAARSRRDPAWPNRADAQQRSAIASVA